MQVDTRHVLLSNTKPKFFTFYARIIYHTVVSNMNGSKQKKKKKSDITSKMSKK